MPPVLAGLVPPLAFGRAEDRRAEQRVLEVIGHAQVQRASVILPDLQRVDADLLVMGDGTVSDAEDLAAERVVLVSGRVKRR